ncbi:ERC protein 2 isoform X3 [Silurus meridionalis]|nr:ERC protein 2 isoform X3 [Silurus meridionalis]
MCGTFSRLTKNTAPYFIRLYNRRSEVLNYQAVMGRHRANAGRKGSECGVGRKTLSMENIQSLNAAYAASGPVYVSDYEAIASTAFPKGTMTLGRTTSHGKAPNISSSASISSSLGHLHLDSVAYADHGAIRLLPQHQWPSSPLLRQAVRGVARREGNPLIEHLRELQMDNNMFRRELDLRDNTLSSSVNSIKTFWSPELKKKRGIRKESVSKVAMVKEQMSAMKDKNQHLQMAIHALQDELCSQKDLNDLLQQENSTGSLGSPSDHFPYLEPTEDNFHYLQAEHEQKTKELFLLRKTVEEMDQRIKKQKHTLNTRDESIKKLLEMLQEKGLTRSGLPDDEGLKICRAEDMLGHLGNILEQKEKENKHLKEELHRRNQQTDPPKSKALHSVIDMKDTKISSLERNIRELEDEIQMLKTNSHLNMDKRDERPKQIDVYKNHSKFMKSKTDQLKQDLSKKESEMLALQTQLDTLTNQNSDCKQHIEVLKESLSAKEQRANIMQTEIDALRLRLEEKESFLNKKSKQLQDLTDEKGTLNGEIHDLKDMLEVKERKIVVLQKKDQLKDKDKQLGCLRDRVKSLQTDSSNTDTALSTLEEALAEKERVIEQLKEKREKGDWDKQEEVEVFKKENKELKDRVVSLQTQLLEKEALEREEASQLNSQISEQLKVLEKELTFHKEESGKSKAEVDRLMGLLKELESERTQKDKAIFELERQVTEQINKNLSSTTNPQTGDITLPDGAAQAHVTQDLVQETAKKIKELEKALRESMNASMHREILWVQEEHAHALAQRQLEDLMGALEKTRQELDVTKQQLSSTQNSLAERESHLSSMVQERRKQLEEILEMKQQALLAAISEKDANIALLELSAPKMKTSQEEVMALKREKDRLMYQLKQQIVIPIIIPIILIIHILVTRVHHNIADCQEDFPLTAILNLSSRSSLSNLSRGSVIGNSLVSAHHDGWMCWVGAGAAPTEQPQENVVGASTEMLPTAPAKWLWSEVPLKGYMSGYRRPMALAISLVAPITSLATARAATSRSSSKRTGWEGVSMGLLKSNPLPLLGRREVKLGTPFTDLAHADFTIILKLKIHLKGRCFNTIVEIQCES